MKSYELRAASHELPGNETFSKQQNFFKPYKITAQQFNILRILKGQYPKSISGTEIKSRMLDKNSDVSRLLDTSAQPMLISRNPDLNY